MVTIAALQTELARLRAENACLKELLQQHGIVWQEPPAEPAPECAQPSAAALSASDKIALFRRLFRGRTDVYPKRWESQKGASGYVPVCDNEWRQGVCEKPRVKCGACEHRQLRALTDQAVYEHLTGKATLGVYPRLPDDTCHFLAMDFDEEQWQDDALAVMHTCEQHSVPASLEISRSGKGAHLWIFFSAPVPAREARLLGAALISHTCARPRQLSLSSYDRFFPSQDTLLKGGFGNLIALPLQKIPRSRGGSVFVDSSLTPYADQWAYLDTTVAMTPDALSQALLHVSGGRHPLDVAFTEEEGGVPWEDQKRSSSKITGAIAAKPDSGALQPDIHCQRGAAPAFAQPPYPTCSVCQP